MTFQNVNKPVGGLAGKTYSLHVPSGMLVMNDPSLQDILACRGMLIVTTKGWEWFTGRAFLDYYEGLRTKLGAEPTMNQLKADATLPRRYVGTQHLVGSSSDVVIGLQRWNPVGELISPVLLGSFVSIHAVPHRSFAGRGSSNMSTIHALNAKWNGNLGLNNDAGKLLGVAYCGPIARAGLGYGNIIPKGWMLGAFASKFTYRQFVDKVVAGMEDLDGIREKVRVGVRTFLENAGVGFDTKVLLPLYTTSDGRMASDFAMRAPDYGPNGGRPGTTFSTGLGGDGTVPYIAGRVCFGTGDYDSFPFATGTEVASSSEPELRIYANHLNVPSTYFEVTRPLVRKLGHLEVSGICGIQPFANFYDVQNNGSYVAKLVDEVAMEDEYWTRWLRFGNDTNATATTPVETPGSTFENQGTALASSVAVSGGRDERTGWTAADTWMLTPRQLVRLCWDPIALSGTSSVWVVSKAHKALAVPMASGAPSNALAF